MGKTYTRRSKHTYFDHPKAFFSETAYSAEEWHQCDRKRAKFTHEKEALSFISNNINLISFSPYKCKFCTKWHITNKAKTWNSTEGTKIK